MKIPIKYATEKQIKYIEQLLIDVGIGIDRERRNGHLKMWLHREIKFLDELTLKEAGFIIGKLKEIKENG